MLRRQPPQSGLHVLLLICMGIAQARRQAHRLRCRIAVAFAPAVRTFFFIHIRLIRTALLSRHMASVSGLLRNKRAARGRSEVHTSELQSLMRTSYAVLRFQKKN